MKKSELRKIIRQAIKEQIIQQHDPDVNPGAVSPLKMDCCDHVLKLQARVQQTMMAGTDRPPRSVYDAVIDDFRYAIEKLDCGPFNVSYINEQVDLSRKSGSGARDRNKQEAIKSELKNLNLNLSDQQERGLVSWLIEKFWGIVGQPPEV